MHIVACVRTREGLTRRRVWVRGEVQRVGGSLTPAGWGKTRENKNAGRLCNCLTLDRIGYWPSLGVIGCSSPPWSCYEALSASLRAILNPDGKAIYHRLRKMKSKPATAVTGVERGVRPTLSVAWLQQRGLSCPGDKIQAAWYLAAEVEQFRSSKLNHMGRRSLLCKRDKY